MVLFQLQFYGNRLREKVNASYWNQSRYSNAMSSTRAFTLFILFLLLLFFFFPRIIMTLKNLSLKRRNCYRKKLFRPMSTHWACTTSSIFSLFCVITAVQAKPRRLKYSNYSMLECILQIYFVNIKERHFCCCLFVCLFGNFTYIFSILTE